MDKFIKKSNFQIRLFPWIQLTQVKNFSGKVSEKFIKKKKKKLNNISTIIKKYLKIPVCLRKRFPMTCAYFYESFKNVIVRHAFLVITKAIFFLIAAHSNSTNNLWCFNTFKETQDVRKFVLSGQNCLRGRWKKIIH